MMQPRDYNSVIYVYLLFGRDANGGKMTNTLLKYFNPDKSYDYIWSCIENDKSLKRYEEVQRTLMGPRFGSKKIFR